MLQGSRRQRLRSISMDDGRGEGAKAIFIDADDTSYRWRDGTLNLRPFSDVLSSLRAGDTVHITTARTMACFVDYLRSTISDYFEQHADGHIALAGVTLTAATDLSTLTPAQLTAALDQIEFKWRDGLLSTLKTQLEDLVPDGVTVVVSTPYDHVDERAVGEGFSEVLSPLEEKLIAGDLSEADYADDARVITAIQRDDKYSQYLYLLESFDPFPVQIACYDDRLANLSSLHAACVSHYSRHPALNFEWVAYHVDMDTGAIEDFTPTVQVFLPHNLSGSGANTTLVDRCEQARRLHGALSVVAAMKSPSGVEGEFVRVGAPVTILPLGDDLTAECLLPVVLIPLPNRMSGSTLAIHIGMGRLVCNSAMSYVAAGLLLELVAEGLLSASQIGMIVHEYYEPDPKKGVAISTTSNENLLRSEAVSPAFNRIYRSLDDRALMVAELQRVHYGFGTTVYNGFQKAMWDRLLADPAVQARARGHMEAFGLTKDSALIMVTGIISGRKGQDIIARVASGLFLSMGYARAGWEAVDLDRVVFLAVGERHIGRPDEEATCEQIKYEITLFSLGGKFVTFPAVPQEQLADFYAMFGMVRRPIAYQTSNCEVMPVSLVEMANAGALPVVTAVGATEELIPSALRLALLVRPFRVSEQAAALERALLLPQAEFEAEVAAVQEHALGCFDMVRCEAFHHKKRCEAIASVEEERSERVEAQRAAAVSASVKPQVYCHPTELRAPVKASKKSTAETVTLPFFGEVSQRGFARCASLAIVGVMVGLAAWSGKKGAGASADAAASLKF